MLTMTFAAALTLIQTVTAAPFLTPSYPGETAADQAYICMGIIALAATSETAANKTSAAETATGFAGGVGYYYGVAKTLEPDGDMAARVYAFGKQDGFVERNAERCGRDMMRFGKNMQDDGVRLQKLAQADR